MKDSSVRERLVPAQRTAGPGLDLIASKLRPPPERPGTIRRSSLIEQLTQGDPRPIVSVVAPPGYGKTTLLSHWAERSSQEFAWVSIDEQDNDPRVLLSYVARAGVRSTGLARELSARLGGAAARVGFLVDDRADRAGA